MRLRYLLAVLVGVLWASAFPSLNLPGAAWLIPGALLMITRLPTGAERLRVGYVAGLTYSLASLYWLLLIPVKWYPILGWVALSAVLALFPTAWIGLCWWLNRQGLGARPDDARFGPWVRRQAWCLACAALWVSLEMLQARLIGGFPWNFLGASQFKLIPLIQTASVTGIYGVSFLVAWFSVALLSGVVSVLRNPDRRGALAQEIWVPTLVVAICFAVGFARINRAPEPSREVVVTVVQPSTPQTDIWNAEVNERRFHELLKMTETALEEETHLVVWPEAAVPELLRWDEVTYDSILRLSRSNNVPMIIGADDAIPYYGPPPERPIEYSNCAWLITPDGKISKPYRKRKLVAFGEYIPFIRVLPFIAWFTPIEGQFTPGTNIVWFDLPELDLRTSTLICFEDTFPHEARRHVDADTDFLVNLTNDGWFGEGAAQWQQATTAAFRAVENGVPLLRATNNGITCWIDRFGRIRQVFRDANGSVYGRGFARFALQLSEKGDHPQTLYNRHGDRFGWGCVGLSLVALILGLVGSRNRSKTVVNGGSAKRTGNDHEP